MKILRNLVLLLTLAATSSACSGSSPTSGSPTRESIMTNPESNTTTPSIFTPKPTPQGSSPVPGRGVVVIQGIFDPSGEKLLELKPVRLYPRQSTQVLLGQQGLYVVKVTYTTGEVSTIPFDAFVADDAGRTVHGFFEVNVPVNGQIDFILITNASGDKTFARISASEILQ